MDIDRFINVSDNEINTSVLCLHVSDTVKPYILNDKKMKRVVMTPTGVFMSFEASKPICILIQNCRVIFSPWVSYDVALRLDLITQEEHDFLVQRDKEKGRKRDLKEASLVYKKLLATYTEAELMKGA